MTKMTEVITGLIAGIAFGAIGTVFHQTHLAGFPIGLVLALSSVAIYGVSLRRSKLRSWAFALSVSGTVFLAAQEFGLDVLIPSNQAGLIWSFGTIGVSLLVAMFPRIR